ncbi:hypothetical protein DPMN_184741 [Dreissena polymorpha]|uniref:Uncharacterized protein n=1 Tax=Dreissena polymorpha TaxID=45954 RepID=A0A9D4I855_DREPO|nr:hypothetical protein DPMN_184741 [Dreissena polymorpha]
MSWITLVPYCHLNVFSVLSGLRFIDIEEFHARQDSMELQNFQALCLRHIDSAKEKLLKKYVFQVFHALHPMTRSFLSLSCPKEKLLKKYVCEVFNTLHSLNRAGFDQPILRHKNKE